MFGVKQSLIVEVGKVDDQDQAKKYGVKTGTSLITYDFVLVTDEAVRMLRRSKAEEAMNSQGRKIRFIDDLPVPDVD